ncbi:DUF2974 domain-containing protein [Alloscardovia theropitheci]|uniref:DUF2974 domain-containing protein n=1 Tax=Alloscardovia theropitheci TaxID=2496842 RepID=A0A4R0QWV7_9BIFI|nr:Mbeg1-like protein [Alloscardovia theropitheci]TCD54010.1 DUF2974 domain-containing protein [Alloscardovia theropitheci]
MNNILTEKDRKKIAEVEYDSYSPSDIGAPVTYGKGLEKKTLGSLDSVVDDKSTGLRMYVVKTDDKHYSVLFRGSESPGKDGWQKDWLDNDVPMVDKILTGGKGVTSQLSAAAAQLQKVMSEHSDAQFDVYGHSLGSMCAQYAAVKVTNPSQIGNVFAYEGPNIYSTLGAQERDTALKLRNKIHNYVDQRDAIALGYGDVFNCIGRLHRIDSKDLGVDKISQHMWGGYQWQDDGGLVEMQPNFNDMKSALSFYREHFPQFAHGKQGQFVLDSVQAEFISDAVAAHAGQLEHNIDTLHTQTVQELRDKVSRAISDMKRLLAILPYSAIDEQLYINGLTLEQVLERFENLTTSDVQASKKISNDFEQIRSSINQGIQKVMDTDSDLAQHMNDFSDSYYRSVVEPKVAQEQRHYAHVKDALTKPLKPGNSYTVMDSNRMEHK